MTQFYLNYFEVWSSESISVNAIRCYALKCNFCDQAVRIRFLRNRVPFNSEILQGHITSSNQQASRSDSPDGAVLACNCKNSTSHIDLVLFLLFNRIYLFIICPYYRKKRRARANILTRICRKKWEKWNSRNYSMYEFMVKKRKKARESLESMKVSFTFE